MRASSLSKGHSRATLIWRCSASTCPCTCRCPRAMGGRRNHHTVFGARLFRQHLVEIGVCCHSAAAAFAASRAVPVGSVQSDGTAQAPAGHPIAQSALRSRRHPLRWGHSGTNQKWCGTGQLFASFSWTAPSHCGNGTVREVDDQPARVLRYLAVERPLPSRSKSPMLFLAMPVGGLAGLPRYLVAEQVNSAGSRHATAKSLRAGVIARSSCSWRALGSGPATAWRNFCLGRYRVVRRAPLRVSGKSRYEKRARLPLPQDVGGDADCRLPRVPLLRLARAITCSCAISRRIDRSGKVMASRQW